LRGEGAAGRDSGAARRKREPRRWPTGAQFDHMVNRAVHNPFRHVICSRQSSSAFKSVARGRRCRIVPSDAVGSVTGTPVTMPPVIFKRRLLRVLCAELVAEMVSCRRAPHLYLTLHHWERLLTVRASSWRTAHKISGIDHHHSHHGPRVTNRFNKAMLGL
jgi:hypothetical protein